MGGDAAKELYQRFVMQVQEGYKADRVKDGVFQAMMKVALVNDGPVSVTSFQVEAPLTWYRLHLR